MAWTRARRFLALVSVGVLALGAPAPRPINSQGAAAGGEPITAANAARLAQQIVLHEHCGSVRGLDFSPDGTMLATASWDGALRLWDVTTGATTVTLAHGAGVEAVAFGPDGTMLVTGALDGVVRLWDVAAGQQTAALEGHADSVTAVAFDPGGGDVASASWDGTVRLWDVATAAGRLVLRGHTDRVQALAFSDDGALLASGGGYGDFTVRLWDAATGAPVAVFTHGAPVYSVAFDPDGLVVASGGVDAVVCVWNIASGAQVAALDERASSSITRGLAFSPADPNLLAASNVGSGFEVTLWDVAQGREVARLPRSFAVSEALAFSSDGTRLAIAESGRVRLWAVGEEPPVPELGEARVVVPRSRGVTALTGPDTACPVITELNQGQAYPILEEAGDWYLIEIVSPDTYFIGYVPGDSVMVQP